MEKSSDSSPKRSCYGWSPDSSPKLRYCVSPDPDPDPDPSLIPNYNIETDEEAQSPDLFFVSDDEHGDRDFSGISVPSFFDQIADLDGEFSDKFREWESSDSEPDQKETIDSNPTFFFYEDSDEGNDFVGDLESESSVHRRRRLHIVVSDDDEDDGFLAELESFESEPEQKESIDSNPILFYEDSDEDADWASESSVHKRRRLHNVVSDDDNEFPLGFETEQKESIDSNPIFFYEDADYASDWASESSVHKRRRLHVVLSDTVTVSRPGSGNKYNVVRDFPPGCGPNAERITEGDTCSFESEKYVYCRS